MFVSLDAKSCYSLLESSNTLKDIVSAAKSNGSKYACLIDVKSMYGAVEFYQLCLLNDLKPIIGLEINYRNSELILLPFNTNGYQEIVKISSFSMKDEEFEISAYRNFYIIVKSGDFRAENNVLNIEEIAFHSSYYAKPEDYQLLEVLKAIKTGNKISGFKEKPKISSHLLSNEEALKIFTNQQLENLFTILGTINIKIDTKERNLIHYPTPDNISATRFLEILCEKGLKKRLNTNDNIPELYLKRLNYELEVISKMSFENYFLVVWDFILEARRRNILIGPGRGSAAGSIVCYALGITSIDPIEYELLFERFLNPERVTMPDIDIDVMDNRRDEIITYIFEKYGAEHVCHIITFQKLKAKMALRDVGRVLDIPLVQVDRISKAIKPEYDDDIALAIEKTPILAEYQEQYPDLFKFASKISGLPRQASVHPAGIVLSQSPISDLVPTQGGINGIPTTQYQSEFLESLGLIKIDILGLRNLTTIQNIQSLIYQRHGIEIKLNAIPKNDEKTLKILSEGKTLGIFQLESSGMRDVLKKLRVDTIDDIIATSALYRPGPMQEIGNFIYRKHGKQKFDYPVKKLEQVLGKTYGIIVYQEQVMQICQLFAGFSLAQADLMRRAISKKDEAILLKLEKSFIEGAKALNQTEKEAKTIYDHILKFANYGFNKSHAVAYSIISYWLAYLKANYAIEFTAVLMSSVIGDDKKINSYISEVAEQGVNILPPTILQLSESFVIENLGIRWPISLIKGLGSITFEKMKQEFKNFGDFKNLSETYARLRRASVSQKIIESLVKVGVFDNFSITRHSIITKLDLLEDYYNVIRTKDGELKFNIIPLPLIENIEEFSPIELRTFEIEFLGYSFQPDPYAKVRKENEQILFIGDSEKKYGSFSLLAVIKRKKFSVSKFNEKICFVVLQDATGSMDAAIFAEKLVELVSALDLEKTFLFKLKRTKSGTQIESITEKF